MSEFETKLRWLSERGNPVGAEDLIERIEAELAGDPLVVVAKRREGFVMTKTQQSPLTTSRPSRNWGPVWGAAVFVAILTVAALFAFADDSGEVADNPPPTTVAPDVETMTDLQIIEAGVASVYSGDAERAIELFGIEDGDDEAQISDDDLIRREAAYQAAIGGRLTLKCTEEVNRPGMFTCNVPYHNALTDAVGYEDSPGDRIEVVVQDGVITQFGIPHHLDQGVVHEFPEHSFLLYEVATFLGEQVEGQEGCVDDLTVPGGRFLLRTPECANLIMDHLDEWANWCGQIVDHQLFASSCENQ